MARVVGDCFFFNDTATTEIYTLSLHDALPIFGKGGVVGRDDLVAQLRRAAALHDAAHVEVRGLLRVPRSEEHTSELQSQSNIVCRLLLEKKKCSSKDEWRPASGRMLARSGPIS